MSYNTRTTCERSGEADECRRLHAESDAAALEALAVLCSEGVESPAFLEADAASEQATQKWLEADRAARRRLEEKNQAETVCDAFTWSAGRSVSATSEAYR
jgi:hypothetical protein